MFTENNETYRLSIIDKFTGTSSSLRLHDSVGLIEVDDISSVGESIFFTARLSSTKIKSLFRYDILAENLVQFPSVYIGGNPNYLGLSVDHLVSGDSIYFVTNGHFGSEIWMAHTQDDDLEIVYAGGSGLPDWNHRPNYLHINDGSLYFTTIAPFPADIRYFWKVDLANYKIETFDYFTNDSIYTTGQGFVVSDNKLFFNGYRADVGSELFYINLLTNKTQIVEDVTEGGLSSNTTPIIRVRDNLFTMSYSDILGRELGTVSISEEPSFQWLTLTGQIPGSSSPNVLTPTSDNLFFIANNVINGTQLWNTDLSTESTNLTQLRSTSIIGSSFRDLTNVNGYLYFKYKNSSNGKYTLGRVSPKGVIKESAYPLVYP
ncbi:MAG: ELWxxDGT repeat protein [Bacteroidia bacterium]